MPGRWLRVVRTPEYPENHVKPIDRETTDAFEAAAVRAGWLLIDAHERLSKAAAAKAFGHEMRAWVDYSNDTMPNLKHPPGSDIHTEESDANRLRYRRTMDFVRRGERLFDVGFGRGYLAALLLRDAGVENYFGIDIVDDWVDTSRAVVATNGLDGDAVTLEQGDLFDLTRDKIESTGASLVICCEVLEHVDDAEKALRILADALPEGAELLFSVPLHGRLESVWGHLSVFDVARLKDMLEGAGLYAHHVEPLANTWSLVVASRSPEPSARVRDAGRRPPVRSSVPLVHERVFVDVPASDFSATSGPNHDAKIAQSDAGTVECQVSGSGGVTFPVSSLEAFRLWFEFNEAEHVEQFTVTAYAGKDRAGVWVWAPKQPPSGRARVSFRPGENASAFSVRRNNNVASADRVEVVATVESGHTAAFELKAAYLP